MGWKRYSEIRTLYDALPPPVKSELGRFPSKSTNKLDTMVVYTRQQYFLKFFTKLVELNPDGVVKFLQSDSTWIKSLYLKYRVALAFFFTPEDTHQIYLKFSFENHHWTSKWVTQHIEQAAEVLLSIHKACSLLDDGHHKRKRMSARYVARILIVYKLLHSQLHNDGSNITKSIILQFFWILLLSSSNKGIRLINSISVAIPTRRIRSIKRRLFDGWY